VPRANRFDLSAKVIHRTPAAGNILRDLFAIRFALDGEIALASADDGVRTSFRLEKDDRSIAWRKARLA